MRVTPSVKFGHDKEDHRYVASMKPDYIYVFAPLPTPPVIARPPDAAEEEIFEEEEPAAEEEIDGIQGYELEEEDEDS